MRKNLANGRRSPEAQAFTHYLRTGQQLPLSAFAPAVEHKFNPNHDPRDGRFITGPAGLRAAASAGGHHDGVLRNGDKVRIVKLKPLNAKDIATVHGIAATRSVTDAMDAAWADSLKTGRENGFFIYRDGDRYYAGQMVAGNVGGMTNALYYSFMPVDPLKGRFGVVAAVFHTHPGEYSAADNADNHDQNFGENFHAITIIKTTKRFIIGN